MGKTICVIATAEGFQRFTDQLNHKDFNDYKLIDDVAKLRGLRYQCIIVTDSIRQLENNSQILNEAYIRVR